MDAGPTTSQLWAVYHWVRAVGGVMPGKILFRNFRPFMNELAMVR